MFFGQGLEGKTIKSFSFVKWQSTYKRFRKRRRCNITGSGLKNCLYICFHIVCDFVFFFMFLYVVAKLSVKKSTAFNLWRFWTCLNSFTNALLFFEYNPGVFDRGWGRDRLQTGQKQFPIWFARPVRLPPKNRSFRAVRHTVRNEAAPTHPADRLNAVEQEMDQREPLVKSCIGYLAT